MPARLRFVFDYISPNAYIAWTQIHALSDRQGRSVEPVPVLFAALLQAHGLLGPAEVPAKSRWMVRDVLRKTARLEIPFQAPTSHPFNPLLALRVSSLPFEPAARRKLIDALFRAVWADRRDVTEPETVAAIADAAGLDGEAAVARAGEPETKDRLRQQSDAAIAAGVFGVPTVLVDDELFWGYDDFTHLENFLAGRDSLRRESLEAWSRVRPSAKRHIR